jgi:hypothetical protein
VARKSKSNRSLAALKGWETRRANIRSKAALKGWETRRANIRSKAALPSKKKKPLRKKKRAGRVIKIERKYALNVEYQVSARNNPEVQIFAFPQGRKKRSRAEIVRALEERIKTGIAPRGWRFRVVEWKKAGRVYQGDDTEATWNSIKFLLAGDAEVSFKKRGRN